MRCLGQSKGGWAEPPSPMPNSQDLNDLRGSVVAALAIDTKGGTVRIPAENFVPPSARNRPP
jgi:hypothetical protein